MGWRRALATVLLLGADGVGHAAPGGRASLFDRLDGRWAISGTTSGKPTRTGAEVHPAFGGRFTEMHISDPRGIDRYEARVFFGTADNGHLVVHWLDGTGGETSRTLGSGRVGDDVITMTFPYPDGTFRDALSYDPATDRWRLLILTGPADHPRTFSDWYFDRVRGG